MPAVDVSLGELIRQVAQVGDQCVRRWQAGHHARCIDLARVCLQILGPRRSPYHRSLRDRTGATIHKMRYQCERRHQFSIFSEVCLDDLRLASPQFIGLKVSAPSVEYFLRGI